MIKLLKKFQIKLTPFDATKEWEMSTTNNQDLLLLDTGSIEQDPVALEFIDYGDNGDSPVINSECDIALEQQPDDLIDSKLGLKTSGLFYPDRDSKNTDGTYKRVVYAQVRTVFYNQLNDITKTWGAENIDFNLGKTQRKISDEIRLFDVPKDIFGDKIVPGSVTMSDNSLETDYSITDDGNGNLIAGSNLFSRYQTVGDFKNTFVQGRSDICTSYLIPSMSFAPSGVLHITATLNVNQVSLIWVYSQNDETGWILQRSIDSGATWPIQYIFNANTMSYVDSTVTSGNTYCYRIVAVNPVGEGNYSNTSCVTLTSNTIPSCNCSPFPAQYLASSLNTALTYDLV